MLGMARLEEMLPEILAGCRAASVTSRDGHLLLLRYLATTLGADYQTHLAAILPPILDGLADENEAVRDAAMGAGRQMVETYAFTSMDMLLPAIEDGIAGQNWCAWGAGSTPRNQI